MPNPLHPRHVLLCFQITIGKSFLLLFARQKVTKNLGRPHSAGSVCMKVAVTKERPLKGSVIFYSSLVTEKMTKLL